MSLTNEAKKEVERLLRAGQKVQAIKYLSDTFRVSLSDAKTLTEAVENEVKTQQFETDISTPKAESGNLRSEIEQLLRSDKKLEAIKLVRQKTGQGLKEALDTVQSVEKEINPNFTPISSTGCAGQVVKIIGFFFLIIGGLLLGGAGLTYHFTQKSIENSDTVKGKVVTLIESTSDGSTTYAPVVSYQWQGQQKTYQSSTYSYPPAFEVGEEVELFVNRDNPDEIYLNTFGERWLVVIILGGIGGMFLLFGLFMSIFGRKVR